MKIPVVKKMQLWFRTINLYGNNSRQYQLVFANGAVSRGSVVLRPGGIVGSFAGSLALRLTQVRKAMHTLPKQRE